MAKYQKIIGSNGAVRYTSDGRFVGAANVSDAVKAGLDNVPQGVLVDENGKEVLGEGEVDVEGGDDIDQEEVQAAKQAAEEASDIDDEEDDDIEEDGVGTTSDAKEPEHPVNPEAEDAPAPTKSAAEKPRRARSAARRRAEEESGRTPESTPGFGFPLSADGSYTPSIFSKTARHEVVRLVAGLTVPLTRKEYDEKTDVEIMDKLEDLGLL